VAVTKGKPAVPHRARFSSPARSSAARPSFGLCQVRGRKVEPATPPVAPPLLLLLPRAAAPHPADATKGEAEEADGSPPVRGAAVAGRRAVLPVADPRVAAMGGGAAAGEPLASSRPGSASVRRPSSALRSKQAAAAAASAPAGAASSAALVAAPGAGAASRPPSSGRRPSYSAHGAGGVGARTGVEASNTTLTHRDLSSNSLAGERAVCMWAELRDGRTVRGVRGPPAGWWSWVEKQCYCSLLAHARRV